MRPRIFAFNLVINLALVSQTSGTLLWQNFENSSVEFRSPLFWRRQPTTVYKRNGGGEWNDRVTETQTPNIANFKIPKDFVVELGNL